MSEELVFMSPNNGALIVAIPLYRQSTIIGDRYAVYVRTTQDEPMAYAIDIGEGDLGLVSAGWIEERFECLGFLDEAEE